MYRKCIPADRLALAKVPAKAMGIVAEHGNSTIVIAKANNRTIPTKVRIFNDLSKELETRLLNFAEIP